MKNVIALLQARVSSSRLPGKVLKPLLGKPLLAWQIERVLRSRRIEQLVLTTSQDPSDDALEELARSLGIACFRGDLHDVLGRFIGAADQFPARHYVRLTGDCPLAEAEVIDRVIEEHLHADADYTTNAVQATYPDGLDVEVMKAAALRQADQSTQPGPEREHVTLSIYRHPDQYRIHHVKNDVDLSALRWTVDEQADFDFVQKVYEGLWPSRHDFTWKDVLRWLEKNPRVQAGNQKLQRNEGLSMSEKKDLLAKRYQKSMQWLERAEKSIPLGSQTFSKSRTQYPYGVSPYFIQKAQGSRAWDVDGNEYVDFVSSLCAVTLGYNDPDVTAAVQKQLQEGVIFSLPHPLETLVAEKIIEMVPCAEKVRFGKNGSDATSGAVRVARAFTGRDHVLTCGYHGWQDWYIGATARNLGVPQSTREMTHVFPYNDLAAAEKKVKELEGRLAAIILEPMNTTFPAPGFLQGLKDLAHRNQALLIFDETITGFRFARGGAQELFGVTPDLATFGKGLANGYPVSAVAGRADVMKLMEEVFFSFTFGGETLSLAASLATLEKLQKTNVLQEVEQKGKTLMQGLSGLIQELQAGDFMSVAGHPTWSFFMMKDTGAHSAWTMKTFFLQEMLLRGFLTLGTHNISAAHTDADIQGLLGAYREILPELVEGVRENTLNKKLVGKPLEPLFKVR